MEKPAEESVQDQPQNQPAPESDSDDQPDDELDLEAYFGDPDGGDNIIDHGTPRKPEPEEEPEEEQAGEPAAAEPAGSTEPAKPAEGAPVEKKFVIKVDGEERELTEEEAREYAQKGVAFTQKTQALSDRERKLTGYEGLISLIDRDPNFRHYVKNYDPNTQGAQGQPAPQPQPQPKPAPEEEKPPEDPVERVKWETRRETIKELMPVIDGLKTELANVRSEMGHVSPQVRRQVDPLGESVQQSLVSYLKTLPEHTARHLYNTWNTDPQIYQEAYDWMRGLIVKQIEANQAGNNNGEGGEQPTGAQPANAGPAEQPAASEQQPAPKTEGSGTVQRKTTERAPLLEGAGAAAVDTSKADRAKKIKALHSRIRNQEHDPRDVGALFDLIDPLE